MTTRNNYDKSSTGTDIECTCFYDTDQARSTFDENFTLLQRDGYRTNTIAWYTDNGNAPDHDSITFRLKGTLEQKAAYLKKQGYTDDDMPQPEDIDDYILETYGEAITLLNYKDANNILTPLFLEPSKRIEWLTTRGYSQSDYAEVAYCPDDLEKVWGNTPDKKQLKDLVDHLFWDTPIYAHCTINGTEYAYCDMPEYDEYKWNKDKFAAYVAEKSGIEKETIAALLPKHPDYA